MILFLYQLRAYMLNLLLLALATQYGLKEKTSQKHEEDYCL
jgi:hypothetical protein